MEDWVRVCGEKGKDEAAVSSWEDKGERRSRAARKPGMAGAWRRVRAAAQNREEEERRRLTGGTGGKILFISFFFLGCDTGSVEEEKEGNQTKPAVPPQMTPNDPMQGKTAGVIQIQCSGGIMEFLHSAVLFVLQTHDMLGSSSKRSCVSLTRPPIRNE